MAMFKKLALADGCDGENKKRMMRVEKKDAVIVQEGATGSLEQW